MSVRFCLRHVMLPPSGCGLGSVVAKYLSRTTRGIAKGSLLVMNYGPNYDINKTDPLMLQSPAKKVRVGMEKFLTPVDEVAPGAGGGARRLPRRLARRLARRLPRRLPQRLPQRPPRTRQRNLWFVSDVLICAFLV